MCKFVYLLLLILIFITKCDSPLIGWIQLIVTHKGIAWKIPLVNQKKLNW